MKSALEILGLRLAEHRAGTRLLSPEEREEIEAIMRPSPLLANLSYVEVPFGRYYYSRNDANRQRAVAE